MNIVDRVQEIAIKLNKAMSPTKFLNVIITIEDKEIDFPLGVQYTSELKTAMLVVNPEKFPLSPDEIPDELLEYYVAHEFGHILTWEIEKDKEVVATEVGAILLRLSKEKEKNNHKNKQREV